VSRNTALRATSKQRGGVTGKGFLPGQSGNPGGRAPGERALLAKLYGQDGQKVYHRLEVLRLDPNTPRKLQAEIDFFIIERFHGRARQQVDVGGTAMDALADAIRADQAKHGTGAP
jgi:hypothetical protein